jgi:ADP-ribose pyrophosphatase YjhB (NUDIX family)
VIFCDPRIFRAFKYKLILIDKVSKRYIIQAAQRQKEIGKVKGIILAGGNLVTRGEKILLVQEKMEEIRGKWNHPVGRTEIDESIIDCAKREGEEETGFTLDPSYLIGVYERLASGLHIVLFMFKSEIIDGKLTVPEDLMDVRWFSREEIIHMEKQDLLAGPYVVKAIDRYQNGNRVPLNSITLLNSLRGT